MSNLSDVVGGANILSGVNYSFVSGRFNSPNSSIYLNQGYVQIPPGVYFRGDFTVIVWIQFKSIQTWARIFDFGNGSPMDNVLLSTYFSFSQLGGYVYSGTSLLGVSAASIQLNQWYHVAFILIGRTGSIFLNGIQSANGTLYQPNSVTRSNNYIGKSWSSGDPTINAIIDDFKIYNGAMSAASIQNDYTVSSSMGNKKKIFHI